MSERKVEGRLLVFWPKSSGREFGVEPWYGKKDRRSFATEVRLYRYEEKWKHIRPGRFFIPENYAKKYVHYIWLEEKP